MGGRWSAQRKFEICDMKTADLLMKMLQTEKHIGTILSYIENDIAYDRNKNVVGADTPDKFQKIFLKEALYKPLVLILDEFGALDEDAISAIV